MCVYLEEYVFIIHFSVRKGQKCLGFFFYLMNFLVDFVLFGASVAIFIKRKRL